MAIPYPKNDNETAQAIRLFRSPRIGPIAYHALQEQCESFDEAFERVIERTRANKIEDYALFSMSRAKAELARGQTLGAHFLHAGSPEYPSLLNELDDRPPFLWALGKLELLNKPTLAIIGSRNPTLEGVRITLQISKLCNFEDIVVVSGLARGIDASAHEAALTGGTIGVVAGGVDIHYPRSNSELQALMSEHGLVVSEMPFGYQPTARDFPKRNRIIAGLSLGVLVVEGNLRSGTKLTVQDAGNYGREIMAIPGHPFSGLAALPNELIFQGATLIRDIDDILAVLQLESTAGKSTRGSDMEPPPATEAKVVSNQNEAIELGRALIEGRAVDHLDGRIHSIKG